MKYLLPQDERGIGHLGLIFVIIALLAVGGIGYFVINKTKNDQKKSTGSLQEALKNAKCGYSDKDLCKFFTSYKAQKYDGVVSRSESDGKKTTTTVLTEGEDKTHFKVEGETSYEMIVIGSITYIKAADGTWWKKAVAGGDTDPATDLEEDAKVEISEPENTEQAKADYKKLDKEKCGDLTCFKYQQTSSSGIHYIWFDDQDYLLRRTYGQTESFKADSTYSYQKVSIKEPTPVKELGENQYLVPGQTQPTTLPKTGDYDGY